MVKNLRESAIKDILDVIEDVNKALPQKRDKNVLNVSSISRASKDLIMSFPVLCDDSIDPKTAAMITKAVERKAVTMLQLLFASCSFNADNGQEILQKWHGNIDRGSLGLDDYLDICDRFSESCDSVSDRRAINEAMFAIKRELKNGDKCYPVSSFSEASINDYKVNTRYGNVMVTEAPDLQYVEKKAAILQKKAQIDDYETQYFKKQLLDNDVKKCNELVPSLMIIRFYSGNDANTIIDNQFIAGVKARLIPVDSYEIIDRINSKNKDRAGLVNLIRATTKEISFVKDYLLAIDKAKIDAKNNSIRNRSARIWKTLEKRSIKSVWKRLWGKANDAGCITTLVISQQVVNVLKKEHDVNITDVKVASTIMDAYNLLALVIVDEATEVARFLYDGDDWFEDLSFNSLERESGDGSYKKVINLLSKMNRG